jgi:hypothetical protein
MTVPTTSAKFLTFDSILQMTADVGNITTESFKPDGQPVNIPIRLQFKVFMPPAIMSSTLLRLLILQSLIIMDAQVQLSVENPPDWAAISINPSTPAIGIGTNWNYTDASIIIAPHDNAPAQGFSLRLKAATSSILNKHVGPSTAYYDLVFKPGYTPYIDIYTANPNRIVGPQDSVTFPIVITNKGNKQTLVTGRITSSLPDGWTAILSSPQILINSQAQGTLVFTVTPPYGVGWHNDLTTFSIEFTPQSYPPTTEDTINGSIGRPVQFQVTVRSRGMSTPGFEVAGVAVALLVTLSIFAVWKKKRA